jgi:aminoglycoside phosphotransferase (APT) family kinase protein
MNDKPLEFWLPALEHLRKIHGLPEGDFQRVPNGKNIVCRLQDLIIKLIPPFWAKDAMREVTALKSFQGKLSVDTPRLEVSSELENWHLLVMSCLQGTSLSKLWVTLDQDQKAHIAFQMGEVAAQLHSVNTAGLNGLDINWQSLLNEQRQYIFNDPNLPEILKKSLPNFLDSTPLPSPQVRNVFLHGDLSAGNLLLRDHQITGLLDFGDAKLGEFSHEFISPAAHMFRGNSQILKAFYSGYGLIETNMQHHLMARALLWYGWPYLGSLIPSHLTRWEDIATFFWQMEEA